MLIRAVIAVENPDLAQRLVRILAKPDVLVTTLPPAEFSAPRLDRENGDLIVVSRALLGDPPTAGVDAIRKLGERPEMVVVRDGENALERARLLAAGVCAVADTEVADDALSELLHTILARRAEGMLAHLGINRATRQFRLADFVSASAAMRAFMETVYRVVDADSSLLILGETGVGKEHLARAIHNESPRADGAFIAVNCGALPDTLLESELFGHEEGAFTGASRSLRGQFELAHGGTIFLDEIGEMPLHLQVKLLQVLETHQIRRIGGERVIDVHVRVMAATNRNLPAEITAGRFRSDLFYRLGALALTVPPLRARREDVPELVDSYLQYFRYNTNVPIKGITPDAVLALGDYAWPGNVRELINVIERAVLLCSSNEISLADLPPAIAGKVAAALPLAATVTGAPAAEPAVPAWTNQSLHEARQAVLASFERAYFVHLLTRTRGRVGETARLAGITARALYDKMRQLGLRKEDFRTTRVG